MDSRKRRCSENTEHAVDHPFYISYPKAIPKTRIKKRKDANTGQRIVRQKFSLPMDSLDLLYVVEPGNTWQKMTSYKSFIIEELRFERGDFISVANERTIKRQKIIGISKGNEEKGDDKWVARILEIRASDANHVYARIQWMYRPYDLPPGTYNKKLIRDKTYDKKKELILSNHLDIIDVLSVSGRAEVYQQPQAEHGDSETKYFWRHAYDWRHCRLYTFNSICPGGNELGRDGIECDRKLVDSETTGLI
ncbi:hypothetical protein FLAG1_10144 [Fusarium langsethiae]|uniref:BAH domain-containing protein n=1 Tax=Fusarium langsethiae TaxID=179993 RepID=A0A0N0DBP0_FUSLA|nr:hypothetical protein FLAG1_10144 [Fusarium langsethiae]GKU07306.1 unnamed protein product [Fusarium langsethiae]GKU10708.1 unnamed protein product [Fusarium langsethiae]